MAETWVANILVVLEYQNFRFRETREANEHCFLVGYRHDDWFLEFRYFNGKPVILREHVNQYWGVIRLGWWGGIGEDGRYMEIIIYGEPVPQGRPKFASFGGHVHAYDPAKSKNYKQLVRFWVTQYLKKLEGFTPYENALCVDLTFYLGIPTSWSKQKRIQASQGVIRPIGKRLGDADNLCKGVLMLAQAFYGWMIASSLIYLQGNDIPQTLQGLC